MDVLSGITASVNGTPVETNSAAPNANKDTTSETYNSTPALSTEGLMTFSSLEQRNVHPEKFLYTEIVKAHLGETASIIIGLLLSLGRLTVREIYDKLEYKMSIDSIRRTLVSLTQLRCVKYLEESNRGSKIKTYYYYNEDGLHLLLYSGLIVDDFSSRFPEGKRLVVSEIIQNILTLGSLSLQDYLKSGNFDVPQHEISSIFVELCEMGFLARLTKFDYIPIQDLWSLLYEKEYNSLPRNSTLSDLKKRTEAKNKAKVEFHNLLEASTDLSKLIKIDPTTSLRTVSPNVPLTINIKRFLKSRRTRQLINFAKARVGFIPSQIYKAALKMTENKAPYFFDPLSETGLLQDLDEANGMKDELELLEEKTPGVTFSAIDVSKYIPKTLKLHGSLIYERKNNKRPQQEEPNQNTKKLKTEDGFVIPQLPKNNKISEEEENNENNNIEDDNEDINTDLDSDDITTINGHLKILAASPVSFVKEVQPNVFYIPYSSLIPQLREFVYDYIIASTLGPPSLRIRRCIKENKLVSEKVINTMALMREKDIRTTIGALIKYNAVEIQEVPRTADRSASRSVFLFRCNESHSYNFVKQNLAWNLANLIYKKEKLKSDNKTLLQKANRDDVKGKEKDLLLPSELNQLKMVNERELNVFSRFSRGLTLWEVFKFFKT
ncbi:DNA-directed RNA polymerase III subunit RPC3 [Nakaseomyces bracarensis]|uniref:DNA-directed RNA polymerase III subunit RPC3 n=1 Tax=Nakaseomyces bracarensis TaxID=273131 RepID=A0ABR4P094_9SACH